jgi:hypothetical protein
MPLGGPIRVAEGGKIAGFAQKPSPEGRFLCWRGGTNRLICGLGTLPWHAKVTIHSYWSHGYGMLGYWSSATGCL